MLILAVYVPCLLLVLLPWLLPSFHPLPTLASEMGSVLLLLCKELCCCSVRWAKGGIFSLLAISRSVPGICVRRRRKVVEDVEEEAVMSILNLPDLALESILGRLSPAGLCNMAFVCRSMKEWCRADHLWEVHMRGKWGGVMGEAACREWRRVIGLRMAQHCDGSGGGMSRGWMKGLSCLCFSRVGSGSGCGKIKRKKQPLPVDSIMSWYLALESGKFWFPAQVYNRESGHVGFMMSCYDAELSYDKRSDTFFARYPPHGRRIVMIEDGVTWDRIRVPPVNTPANELHISDCLYDLRPGDHIEIQWRRTKEFPYGWWYGVVGHMTTCDQTELHCHCHSSDTVTLDFKHYAQGSQWRQAIIDRKDHREKGSESEGFYGGIRRLQKEEISVWQKFWPSEILE